MYSMGDKVTVLVDESCSFPKGHRGTITGITYEVDDGYEYTQDEIMPTKSNPLPTLESNDQSKMNFETEFELKATIASLESELLGLYRKLHRSATTDHR